MTGIMVDKTLELKHLELQTLIQRLHYMPAHDGLFLLSNVVSVPRLLYILRTTPCTGYPELQKYDDTIRSALEMLLNVELSTSA